MQEKPLILIVDDDLDIRRMLEFTCKMINFDTIGATNGRMAIQKTIEKKPDLIILDINMPGLNGFETIQYIKASNTLKHIPVIFISGAEISRERIEYGLSMGASEYMPKPFSFLELAIKIRFHIEKSRLKLVLSKNITPATPTVPRRTLMKNRLVASPLWGEPSTNPQFINDVFVLMPFREELNFVYNNHVKRAINLCNLSVKRGDDFFSREGIMRDVWSGICAAKVVIADCTGRNPNVFYEMGIAHTLGKPIIMLTQNPEDFPRDLRHLRFIYYKTSRQGLQKLEENIIQAINLLSRDFASANSGTGDGITITPIWGVPSPNIQFKNDIFAITPFTREFDDTLDFIRYMANSRNLTVKNTDDLFAKDTLIKSIWAAIYFTRLFIADCTGRDPNVFYELGIAHTLGKASILLAQSEGDLPFDLRALHFILYDKSLEGFRYLRKRLLSSIDNLLDMNIIARQH